MLTDDEKWALAQSIQLTPHHEPLTPEQHGVVIARPHPAGWFISARHQPGLPAADLEDFASFVQVRTFLLLDQGPHAATWESDGAGGWRAYCSKSRLTPRERVHA